MVRDNWDFRGRPRVQLVEKLQPLYTKMENVYAKSQGPTLLSKNHRIECWPLPKVPEKSSVVIALEFATQQTRNAHTHPDGTTGTVE